MTRSLTRVQNPGAFLRVVLVISGAIVFAFCLDAFLFRTNLYTRVLEPDSSTGLFELILRREQQARAENGDNLVITLGDSRFAYSPRLANELSPHGIVLRSAGVAGTDPRSWYYMLRDLDPSREHYRAVVLGVNAYDDEDEDFEPDDDIRALKYVIARLRITDTFEFAGSFYSPEFKWAAFRGALFKGTVYQADLLAFLAHPQKRRERALLYRQFFAMWTYNYLETKRSMTGLAIDWSHMTAAFPPNIDSDQRDTVQTALLHGPVQQTGRLAAFRRRWFGRIIDRYHMSHTKIVFIRLPRGPIPRPDGLVQKRSSSIREFASRPNVLLCDEHAFDSLERPELFKDGVHLNRAGVAVFSERLATKLSTLLTAAKR